MRTSYERYVLTDTRLTHIPSPLSSLAASPIRVRDRVGVHDDAGEADELQNSTKILNWLMMRLLTGLSVARQLNWLWLRVPNGKRMVRQENL